MEGHCHAKDIFWQENYIYGCKEETFKVTTEIQFFFKVVGLKDLYTFLQGVNENTYTTNVTATFDKKLPKVAKRDN